MYILSRRKNPPTPHGRPNTHLSAVPVTPIERMFDLVFRSCLTTLYTRLVCAESVPGASQSATAGIALSVRATHSIRRSRWLSDRADARESPLISPPIAPPAITQEPSGLKATKTLSSWSLAQANNARNERNEIHDVDRHTIAGIPWI